MAVQFYSTHEVDPREKFKQDTGQFLDRLRTLEDARITYEEIGGADKITIEGLNNGEPIDLKISHDEYESQYVAPYWTKFFEAIVKGVTIKTNINGTYDAATGALDVSETLDKVENNYGS